MDKVQRNAIAFSRLMEFEYLFVVAYKGKKKKIYLKFAKEDFHHLEGIGQLNDLTYHSMPAAKTFQMALEGKITEEKLKKSQKYFSKSVNNKVDNLYLLETFLDNNEIVFNFVKDETGKTKIDAKMFLYTDMDGNDIYLFIDSIDEQGDVYFSRSFVAKSSYNYRVGQRKLTVLWKEKIHKKTKRRELLYRFANFEPEPTCE